MSSACQNCLLIFGLAILFTPASLPARVGSALERQISSSARQTKTQPTLQTGLVPIDILDLAHPVVFAQRARSTGLEEVLGAVVDAKNAAKRDETKQELEQVIKALEQAKRELDDRNFRSAYLLLPGTETALKATATSASERRESQRVTKQLEEALSSLSGAAKLIGQTQVDKAVLLPDLAAQTTAGRNEEFTGFIIVEQADGDKRPSKEGDGNVSLRASQDGRDVFTGVVTVDAGGKIRIPSVIKEIGNVWLTILITDPLTGQKRDKSHHVTILPGPNEKRPGTQIAHVSETVSNWTVVRWEGQRLDELSEVALIDDKGSRSLLQSVGSSLQGVGLAPAGLEKGSYHLQGKDEKGNTVRAPNRAVNPEVSLTGPQEVRLVAGQPKPVEFALTSNADVRGFLEGGEPRISVSQRYYELKAGVPSKVQAIAHPPTGPFFMRWRSLSPDELSPGASSVAAQCGIDDVSYDPGANETTVRGSVNIAVADGRPAGDVPVDVAIPTSQGVHYARATTNNQGRGSFLHTITGRLAAGALSAFVYRVLGHAWKKEPGTTVARECVLTEEIKPGPGIQVEVVAPLRSAPPSKTNGNIPLIVKASDTDQLLQKCLCADRETQVPSSKLIDVVDTVSYAWSLLGEGDLLSADGPATLYHPPDIEVGKSVHARAKVEVRDSRGNDKPADVVFTIIVRREGVCKYTRSVFPTVEMDKGAPLEITPRGGPCQPQQEKWSVPVELSGDTAVRLKVCAGERVILRASGVDYDTLELACDGGECGTAYKRLEMIDEMIYTWTAEVGGFPDYETGAVTNSRNTTVIYKAPEKPGKDTVWLTIRDSGKQASDSPIRKRVEIEIHEVDLQIENVHQDDKWCQGCLQINDDDDNRNGKPDKDENPVKGEDDLVKITLDKQDKTGTVKLKVNYSGRGRVRVWEDREKNQPAKSEYPASVLPKPLWVEGVELSDKTGDVELVLECGDPKCQDKQNLTVTKADLDVDTNRDGKIDELDDPDEDKPVDYKKSGALVLANLDDDAGVGKVDCDDDEITSEKDTEDFSKMIARKVDLPKGWSAWLDVEREGARYIHIFKELKKGAKSIIGPVPGKDKIPVDYEIPAADLKAGDVTFYVEGITPGKEVTIKLKLYNGEQEQPACGDEVRMLVTPIIFHPNTHQTKRVFYSEWQDPGSLENKKFIADFQPKAVELLKAENVISMKSVKPGIFVQDIFEIGYQRNPANHEGKEIVMPTVIDLPWMNHGLTSYPKEKLLKPDFGFFRVGEDHPKSGDDYVDATGVDYGGNLETVPEFQADLPFGQIVVGDNMSEDVQKFLREQKVQAKDDKTLLILPIKGSTIVHVDEVVSFVPSSQGKGFKVVIGDLEQAIKLLKESASKELKALRDKYQDKAVQGVLDETKKRLKDIKAKMISDGGLTEEDFVQIPVLYKTKADDDFGLPNAVNMQVINGKLFVPAPVFDKNQDAAKATFIPFQDKIRSNLKFAGVNENDIIFVNTSQMTGFKGEAHCATNAERLRKK